MPAKQSTEPDLVAELGVLLGGSTSGDAGHNRVVASEGATGQQPGVAARVRNLTTAAVAVTLESVNKLTQRQLQDASKKLGLTAVSKLKKDALAKAVLEAWEMLVAAHAGPAAARPTAAGPAAADAEADHQAVSHKFEVGEPGRVGSEESRQVAQESAKDIPWGYGRDRVTAMPIDPDRLFVYWETLDDSIARARNQLGLGGPGAWLNLRVYDTTGRIFDGTNAHETFDHRVERGDRQWFFTIGKPTSELIVEVGLKSHEGYFVKIARSGRVEFPRREPAPSSEPEWLTVRMATGQVERAGGGHAPGRPPRPPSQSEPPLPDLGLPRQSDPFPVHTGVLRHVPWEDGLKFHALPGERHEWEEVQIDGTVLAHRQFRWQTPATVSSWQAGPFPYPVETPDPVRETYPGRTRVFRTSGRTHIVHGPWQVVIRGLGAQQSRSVLSRWEVYRSWTESASHEGQEWGGRAGGAGASERLMGSSERSWMGSSELRLAGSSELHFLGASELLFGGASERSYAGASEWVARGASERRLVGASEWMLRGASERQFLGGSESRAGGSEGRLGGASERAPRGAASGAPPVAVPPQPSPGQSPVYPPPPGGQFRSPADNDASRKGS